MKTSTITQYLLVTVFFGFGLCFGQRPMEYLDRGVVALETTDGVYLSWRMLGTDPKDIGFHIYRNDELITSSPVTTSTNFMDENGSANDVYTIESLLSEGSEKTEGASVWKLQPSTESPGKPAVPFKRIPLPEAPVVAGVTFTPGDMSVGDLNGDGSYELIFEWEPDRPEYSYLEAIDLEGNSLWRVEGGPNVTMNKLCMLVYDFDMDGKAEVAMKTGPGTKDGMGNYLSKGPAGNVDHSLIIPRQSGNLLEDPSFITLFDGETGAELATTEYFPPIRDVNLWGDDRGHRASSLKAAVLYDKDQGPLMVYTRGIYEKIEMGAFSWNGTDLNQVWTFDSDNYTGYRGQGNHSVGVGDVDGDGSDELMYGACAIDNDGKGLYTTGRGHGDSHHLADHMPDRPGLEYFQPHENNVYGLTMRDAGTGEIIWEYLSPSDVGRAWAADVDPTYRGSEVVAIGFPNYDANGNVISTNYNAYDQPIYFDGDVQRESRNQEKINSLYGGPGRILTGWYYGASTLHYTKHDANLVADILGDWREEIIFKHYNNQELLLFSTWLPTERKNYTLMHDPLYRMNIVVQSIGYNQPAHTSYYLPDGIPDSKITIVNDPNLNISQANTINNKLQLYPNPADEYISLSFSNKNRGLKDVTVYNLIGSVICQNAYTEDEIRISTKNFSEGLYLLKVSSDAGDVTQRFLVDHH